MIAISLDPQLAAALPRFAVGIVEAGGVRINPHDTALWSQIDARLAELQQPLQVEAVPELPPLAALRRAYRTLGKDPTRYRGSQEALLRRVVKGKGLYPNNTAVDINNLLSLESFHSIGMFDADRIEPPVVLRAGRPGETYYGIGRDLLNVGGLPLLCDQAGPFGSPTSDSERTKVTTETTALVVAVLSFTGSEHLDRHCRRMADLLCRHAFARPTDIATATLTNGGLQRL